MGLRMRRSGGASMTLEKKALRSSRALRRAQDQAADQAVTVAKQMTPVLSGNLELSITREDRREGRRVVSVISARAMRKDFDYAAWAHESEYNLGPLSQQKQETGRFQVGRKYLTRALRYVLENGYLERARAAVKKGLK